MQACRPPRKRDIKKIPEKKSKEADPVFVPVVYYLLDICIVLCNRISNNILMYWCLVGGSIPPGIVSKIKYLDQVGRVPAFSVYERS